MGFLALVISLANFTRILCAADAPAVKPAVVESTAAADPASEEALKILTKAQKTMSEFKTFKAEILNTSETSKTKTKTALCQRNNPDGVAEMRVDSEYEVAKIKHLNAFITNREGQWYLTPKIAIKMEFREAMLVTTQRAMAGVNKSLIMPPSYSLSEAEISGRSYWVVKESISEDIRQKAREMVENNPEMKEALKAIPPGSILPIAKITLYRIGKEDGVLYSTQQYDDKGNKMNDVAYEHVQINLPLADDVFAVPKNLKRKVAKTSDEFTAMMIEAQQ